MQETGSFVKSKKLVVGNVAVVFFRLYAILAVLAKILLALSNALTLML